MGCAGAFIGLKYTFYTSFIKTISVITLLEGIPNIRQVDPALAYCLSSIPNKLLGRAC